MTRSQVKTKVKSHSGLACPADLRIFSIKKKENINSFFHAIFLAG